MVDQKLVEAWLNASEDLGIEVVAPFVLESKDQSYHFVAFVKDFGGENGTLITTANHGEVPEDVVREHGYYWSALYPEAYSAYNREEFIAMLNDWGWFGAEGKEPSWYTGEPWS
jgi:hypothetical protein